MLKTSSTDTSKEDALAFIKSQAQGTADTGKADALAFIKEQAKQEKQAQGKVQSKIQGSVKRQPAQQSLLVSPTQKNNDDMGPSAFSHVSGSMGPVSQPVNRIENAVNTARQAAIDKTQSDLDAVQRRVNHLHDVMQGDDPRAARRAEQELRAMQPIYRNMYGAYERASGLARTGTTEDQVRAASDALDQAKGNALSASLRLGAALTAKGGNPYSDNDADLQAWVQQATEESSAAHAAEQEAASQYNKLASDLQYQKYASLRGRDDFLLRSGGNAADAKRWKAASFDPAKRMYANVYSRGGDNVEDISNDPYNFIQDDERSIFFYLWNTEGQKAATEYINSIKHLLNERKAQQRQKDIAGIVDSSPLAAAGMSAVSTLLNQASIAGVVDLTVQNIRRMMGDNRPIDYNTPLQAPGQITQQIRNEVSKNLEERFPDFEIPGIVNLASFAYQTGMSIADSGLQLVLNRFGAPEPVTLSLMSGGAAQQAVYDAKERGASDGQALLAGYAAGIAEYAFEKISLDKLVGSIEAKAGETIGEKLTDKWVSKLAKKVGTWVINTGVQSGNEALEETFTTLANTVTDLMINGDKSELLKDIDEMGTGPALQKWASGLFLDAMGGLLSGFVMGTSGNVIRYAGGVAEDAASAARAAAEKESGQAQAEAPAEPETRTAPPTPSESNPLSKALDKLRSGEQLTKNDARRIMEDEASMQTLRDAGLARDIRPGGDGREQIRQAVESYARLNTNLLTQAQAQGNLETNTEEVVSNGRTVETPNHATAETAGERQPQTSFRERARAAAETQRSREILDREERRSGLGRFLAEYRANRAQRSAESQFDEQNRRANSLRNQAETRNLTFTSAAEQGVPGGTEDQTFQVMPADMLDRNMRTAQQEAAKNGIDLRFMIGQGHVNDASGDYNFRGWISADGKRMLIQADHSKLTWQQILDHEELHKLIKSAPGYREAVEDALLSDARLQPYLSSIVDRYAEAYNSLGVTDENEIIEELLADYRAGFDMLDIARGKAGDVRTKATAKKDIRAVERRGVVPAKQNKRTGGEERPENVDVRLSREMEPEYNSTALLTEDTVDRWLKDYASRTSPKYAQAYVTRMTPNQFLRLTTSRTGRLAIDEQTRELDAEKLIETTQQNPLQLIISDGEVVGHEGRHRANALLRAGVKSIPVLVFDSSNKYSKQTTPEMTLQGQDFGRTRSYATETLRDLTPLSYENRDKIVQDYVAQPAYERMQEKYSGRKTIKFSRDIAPEQDADYMAAVKSGDMETAQRMVDAAAKAAGFTTPRLYHGTRGFGFTVFDTSKSDDNISLFATSSPRTAETYSGETRRNRISDRSNINVDSLSGEQLLDAAKQNLNRYQDYRLMTSKDKEAIRKDARQDILATKKEAQTFINDHGGAFDLAKEAIVGRLTNALTRLASAGTEETVENAWDDWNEAVWDFKDMDDSLAVEFLDAIGSKSLFFAKNHLADLMYSGDMYITGDADRYNYIFDNQLALELDAGLHKGIYELFGKPGKQLVIDANGENWNQITPPDELNLYGPQRTRDIAAAAKALGYDSVLFKDLRDNGGETAYNGTSDVYIFFNGNDMKSADPVTYDDQGKEIPLSERFNPKNDDIRFSREIDDEYMAAVESGEEWKAERMVRDAALAWGAETDENGKPLDLYHGTPRFGFTKFDMGIETDSKGMIYTSTKREVSANYAGRDHYAGTRPIGTRFIENATKTKDIIQNAKSVYESDYHVMTGAERAEVREKVEADVNALLERYNALKDRDKLFQWDDEDYSFTNALAWVEDLFYTIQGNRENYDSAEEYRNALDDDLERFERNLEQVRNYLSEHYKELRGTDAYRFLTGYDMFDLYVDIAHSYRKVLSDGELIQNKAGNIQVPAELQKAMDGIHNIGAYHLYGNLGQNPATVDAEHRDWFTVKAPDIMGDDKYHFTDAIAKKAREQGYTGLVVKNVYDGGIEADDYIFFNANQVKSADPVTYDDDGQVIPITERFNPENQDIRYSREIDPQEIAKTEYLTEQRRTGRTGGRGRKKVSRVRTHAYELGGLYNEVEAQMAETQPGEFTYDPISEKRSMDEALGRLRKDFTGEAKKLSDAAEWGGSDLDTAMGILHQYRQIGRDTGDYSLFNEWSHTIQEKGTKGGQFVQAFAKYSRTATERARKAAEDLRDSTSKLTPAEQKRVQGHVDELLGAIDGAAEEAAREAVEGQKGLQLPTATGDNQKAKDALNIIKEIHDIFALRSSKSHGVPVEDWTKETGDRLADRIASRLREPTTKTQATMQTILSDLVTFAQEHALPTQEARQHRTALDRITDYLNNREAYAEAWDEAKQVLRDMYADDEEKLEALGSFLNATISYNGEDFDRTMYRAILESADLLGMSKQDILDLAAVGTTESVIDRIAGEFIKRVGTDDANLRDTVARHITNLVMENNVGRRLERMENEASKALDIKLQDLLRESRRTKADVANRIAQYLINDLDISSTDAAIAADHIAGHYMDRLNQRANRELERMFAERGERLKPKQRDKLLDLIRLGGLTNANVEDAVVDTLGLGKLSRAKQREITATMAQFADTLDAIEDNDLEGLRSLIRQQAAARNTKLDRMAEKVLSGETDVEYVRNLAMAQLDLIAADYKPRTAGEKISTVQIISHLLNARTAMRNLTSNQVFDMVDSLANNVGLLPDIIMGAITGQRSVGLNKSWASQQKRQGALQGAGRNLLEIALDAAPNDRNQSKYGTGGRRTFAMASSGTVGKILSQAERILGYELNTTDEFHKGSVYGETMESLARFVDRGDMTVEQAAEFATDMALYRSFQDSTVIGSILGGLKDVLNIIGTGTTNGKTIKGLPVHDFGLGDLVVKYTQVPGALIHRAIEFSPVGYLKAIYNIAQLGNLKSKGESTLAKQRAAALSIGRATTGTGLITLFALLAKAGLLRRKDDEKDKNAAALRQSQGFDGTQLNVSALGRMLSGGSLDVQEGDVLADIGFLEPLDSLMTIAALAVNDPEIKAMDLYDMFRSPKTAGKMGEKSLQGIWLALEDTSAMQTLSNIYSTVRYHDEANDLPLYMQIPMEIAASSVSGFIPAPIRQIAQATDTVYRDQYRSQNLLDQTAAKVANAIPGVRQQLAPKLTPLGEEKAYQAPALNALNALLSPGNISVYHSTAVTDEFLRVYDETGEAKILPERNAPYSITINKEKYTLTPDERTQYQETRGKVTTQFADAVRKSKWYKALPADEQAEVLNWCGNFANYVAKTAFMTERGEEYTSKTYAKYYEEWKSGASPADVAAKANKQNPDGTASRSVPTLKLPTAAGDADKDRAIVNTGWLKHPVPKSISGETEEETNILMELWDMEGHGGNVNLRNRKAIPITEDNADTVRGWGMDADGGYMTVASQTYRDGNTAIVVTPILRNGDLMTQQELDAYMDDLMARGGNYADNDDKGIILGVFGDSSTWSKNLEDSDAFANRVHELHEELEEIRGKRKPTKGGTTRNPSGLKLPTK